MIEQIKQAAMSFDSEKLRELIEVIAKQGISGASQEVVVELKIAMRHVALYGEKSPAHQQNLIAMLGALERGNHPYDDAEAMGTLLANAAIAKAKLESQQ